MFIQAAEKILGKVVQARRGSTYQDLLDTWDNGDGAIPTEAVCLAEIAIYQVGAVSRQAQADLAAGDAGQIRIIEDLIDTLIAKGVIVAADLPASAQTKINNRKTLRGQL